MTYKADEMQEIIATIKQTVHADTYRMNKVVISLDPNDNNGMNIICHFSKGVVVDSTFVPAKQFSVLLDGEDLRTAVRSNPDPTKDFYVNIKNALWQLIRKKDHLPNGQIQ